jgi:hypothetical protein
MTEKIIAVVVLCVAAAVAFVVWFVWFSNNKLVVTHYKKYSEKINSDIKIVHLSDLHAKSFGKGNKKLVAEVFKLSPDFIAFTGDIIHKYRKRDIAVALECVKSLCAVAPFIYVCGNHEMRNKKYSNLKGKLRDAGAIVLDDEHMSICGIDVVGLNCSHLKNNTLFKVMPQGDNFKLLLAHEPQFLVGYSKADVQLVLCGHAHGGQWRLPFTNIGVYAPGQGLFPKYTCGQYYCGNTEMIVSRGLGNSECPLRLFNRPEIVVVQLQSCKK